MTKTLYLFRHAKATEAGRGGASDRDRPLTADGMRDAERMGARMAKLAIAPDVILCSPSRRTIQTLEHAGRAFPHGLSAEIEEPLYMAGAGELLARVQDLGDRCASVMVVGHDPTCHELALALARRGDPKVLGKLADGFPKGALAGIAFPANHWAEIGAGALVVWETPKRLRAADD